MGWGVLLEWSFLPSLREGEVEVGPGALFLGLSFHCLLKWMSCDPSQPRLTEFQVLFCNRIWSKTYIFFNDIIHLIVEWSNTISDIFFGGHFYPAGVRDTWKWYHSRAGQSIGFTTIIGSNHILLEDKAPVVLYGGGMNEPDTTTSASSMLRWWVN